jgi:hypothetical protein
LEAFWRVDPLLFSISSTSGDAIFLAEGFACPFAMQKFFERQLEGFVLYPPSTKQLQTHL